MYKLLWSEGQGDRMKIEEEKTRNDVIRPIGPITKTFQKTVSRFVLKRLMLKIV